MKAFTRTVSAVLVAAGLAGCIVQPAVVAPPPRTVIVAPAPQPVMVAPAGVVVPPGVVYAAPGYPIPAPGYVWVHHPRYGWGWHHPHRGWHRGW